MEDRGTARSVADDAKLEAELAEMEARIVARLCGSRALRRWHRPEGLYVKRFCFMY
jgi:hypothetical protein